MKETNHKYRGFEIIGTTYEKSGSEIFYTGYYRPNSFHRNYNIKKDGRYVINPYLIFEKLKYAKDEIDRILAKPSTLIHTIDCGQTKTGKPRTFGSKYPQVMLHLSELLLMQDDLIDLADLCTLTQRQIIHGRGVGKMALTILCDAVSQSGGVVDVGFIYDNEKSFQPYLF